MSLELTSQNVEATFKDCLFTDVPSQEEIEKRAVIVEGIMNKFGFVPEKLEEHREDIISMLSCLSDDFMEGKGGGMSFLNACMTKDGIQWGEHPTMDLLFSLGQAIGVVKCVMPRNMWSVLPGGMPYYQVKLP